MSVASISQEQLKMSQFKITFLFASFLFALSISVQLVAAQGPAPTGTEGSYEVSLQVLVGSNDQAAGSAVPQSLAGVVRELKPRFTFENYRLVNTYFGRIANAGTFEYKSVTSITGQDSESDSPSFLEWAIGSVREAADSGSRPVIQTQNFRFGARVPVRVASYKEDAGKNVSSIVYEAIGLNVNRLNFRENVPTVIGTLNLPKTSGTLFLVFTARHVE
jgi:hypothetical protein